MESIQKIIILSVLVEAIVQYFISNPDKKQDWLKYVSATIGIILCVVYKADIFFDVGLVSWVPYVGEVATGLIIGRGSNYLSDFIGKIRKPKIPLVITTTE